MFSTKSKTHLLIIILLLLCQSITNFAQQSSFKKPKIPTNTALPQKAVLIGTEYNAQMPIGKLADRFGFTSGIGLNVLYKNTSNWLWGFEARFVTGKSVKEDSLLTNLHTSDGYLIGSDGLYVNMGLAQRGWHGGIKFGKMFSLNDKKPNAGLCVWAGVGYLRHKIYFDNKDNIVPQIAGEYAKGYDRLTGGFALSQFFGYMMLDAQKHLNFYAGIEAMQALTKLQRSYLFDVAHADAEQRIDLLLGIKIGWILPLYSPKAIEGEGEEKKKRYYTN